MKKKLLYIMGIVCSVGLFPLFTTGCGSNAKEAEEKVTTVIEFPGSEEQTAQASPENGADTTEQAAGYKGYAFIYNGVVIEIDALAEPVLTQLGEANSYFEAPSCAFQGIDKMYTYNSFELDTYPREDSDYVSSVLFKDDSVTTAEGIGIGDSAEKLAEAYGSGAEEENGMVVYRKDGMKLCFIVEDDSITSIEYKTTILDE